MKRRVLISSSVLLAAAVVTPGAANARASTAALTPSAIDPLLFNIDKLENQFYLNFDLTLKSLESVPLNLQQSIPANGDYSQELSALLGGREILNGSLVQMADHAANAGSTTVSVPAGTTLFSNPFGCAREVAWFIVQWGVPIFKVIGWFRKIRTFFSTWRAIRQGLRNGSIRNMIGAEGYRFIEAFLGFGSVLGACA